MAETIRGINVVIGAETTGLSKALTDVNTKSKNIQSELKQVEKLLKLDPTNTELLAQKQKLLGDAVANTREKLDRLKATQEQVNQQFAKGDISEGQYRAFQREIAKTEQELKGLEGKLGDVSGEVKKQSGLVDKLGDEYKESFDQAQQAMGNSFEQMQRVGAAITAAGVGIAAGLGIAVKSASEFEQGMANVYSVMAPDEVAQFSAELENLAMKMGADTKYSATEAARGIEELVKAGVSVQDIMGGGLQGALSLAVAGELELADAAEIASVALNAFRDDNISVSQAADILAGAANASATSVEEMKFGLSQVSAVASSVGLTFQDTSTALAVFAQNGLKGSDAGTSLKTMLMRLTPTTADAYGEFDRLGLISFDAAKAMKFLADNGIKPASSATADVVDAMMTFSAETVSAKVGSEQANKAFKEMAFNSGALSSAFYDSNGNLKEMSEIADLLQNALKDMTAEQRQVALNTMFGSDAIRAANILYKEGAKGVTDMAVAMGKISANEVAAQKLNTFKGAIEQLGGAVDTAKISIGQALLPALQVLVSAIQSAVDVFNRFPDGVKSFIAIAGAIAAIVALIAGPLLLLVGFLPQIAAGFGMLAPVLAGVGGAFTALTGPIGLVILAIAALAAAAYLIYENWDAIKEYMVNLWDSILSATETAWEGIKQYFATTWNWIQSFFTEWGPVILAVIAPFIGIPLLIQQHWGEIVTYLAALWQNVKQIASDSWNLIVSTVLAIVSPFVDGVMAIFYSMQAGLAMIWDGIKLYFGGVWNAIKSIFLGAVLLIYDLVTGNFTQLVADAQMIWLNLQVAFGQIWEGIKLVFFGALEAVKGYLTLAWTTIKTLTETIWGGILQFFSFIWESLKALNALAMNAMRTSIETAWNAIKTFFTEAWNKIKWLFTDGLNNAKETVVSGMKQIKSDFISYMNDTVTEIKEFAEDFVEAGEDFVISLWDGIKSKTSWLWKQIKGWIDGLISQIRGALSGGSGGSGGNNTGDSSMSGAGGGGSAAAASFSAPGLKNGGTVTEEGWTWVGENGIELLKLPRGSQVIPNYDIPKIGGQAIDYDALAKAIAANTKPNVTMNNTFNSPTPLSPAETARKNLQVSRRLALEWGL
ncbi:phage tail tape measure protein [Brevibacillus choshinensis]|uniref:Phage tail tape measure protein n=1 Tax=Brevibacillus choshinensis TaxID=54911 RepID=A0ABX7FM53_BRECH|nr:phage tail tape measure protein [Brevibacillus choshinensis]QRG66930.1 phage tail tape measure protein [Brevibacillus choshinensis]